ncbi:Uncharacterised protein [Chlamydia abortus]|nr:Uncharacterised protein [Chlamydia abortus]
MSYQNSTEGSSSNAPLYEEGSLLKQPKAVWAVFFACIIAFMGLGLVDPILLAIADQLEATPSEVSLLLTSYNAVMVVAMLITGAIIEGRNQADTARRYSNYRNFLLSRRPL